MAGCIAPTPLADRDRWRVRIVFHLSAQVIGVTKLRTKYKQFEARRQLLAAYDRFLADDRVVPMLPKLLGNKFFERKR